MLYNNFNKKIIINYKTNNKWKNKPYKNNYYNYKNITKHIRKKWL